MRQGDDGQCTCGELLNQPGEQGLVSGSSEGERQVPKGGVVPYQHERRRRVRATSEQRGEGRGAARVRLALDSHGDVSSESWLDLFQRLSGPASWRADHEVGMNSRPLQIP